MDERMSDEEFESDASLATSIAGGPKLGPAAAVILTQARRAVVAEARRARESEARLLAEVETLRTALEPFARFEPPSQLRQRGKPETEFYTTHMTEAGPTSITLGDFDRARAVHAATRKP